MTDRQIDSLAMAAAPPDDDMDTGVAPYIARAEKELRARKEAGSMDIFDRIAKAAETEFDDQAGSLETRVLENPSDGRRVGTRKWQPTKAVRKRMEDLEKARMNGAAQGAEGAERSKPVARRLRTDVGAPSPEEGGPEPAPAPEPAGAADMEDDGGLSVVPGARGRRRNRARKSSLDEDFENVFAEEDDKPSIQNLRRKMRERPAGEPGSEKTDRGGRLGGILRRKDTKDPGPVALDAEDREDDPEAGLAASRARADDAVKTVEKAPAADFDDEDDWEDEDAPSSTRRRIAIYALIALAAAAAFLAANAFVL